MCRCVVQVCIHAVSEKCIKTHFHCDSLTYNVTFLKALAKHWTLVVIKLWRYHDTIEYQDTNLETILISDRFGFYQNIDISRYIAIYRDID